MARTTLNKTKKFDDLEAILLFLYEQINKTRHDGASKFKTLKLLYQLKQELPPDHPLQEHIPFYWYQHGPYSDIINNKIDILSRQYLLKIPNKNKFKINPDFTIDQTDYNPEIINQKVKKIIKKLMVKNTFEHITRIVYQKAPYPFMPIYKLELWENIENYVKSILQNDENPDLIQTAINLGYKCEANLPFEPYYTRYEDLFSNFLTSLDKIYQNEMADYYNKEIKKEVQSVWYTFTYGLRVKQHDKCQIYENQTRKWDIQFQKKLDNLNFDLKKFREIARKTSNNNKANFSDTSKKILSATIGTYIK